MNKLGFIGTGSMGGALARAARQNCAPEEMVLSNRSPEKARALAAELGCAAVTPEEAAASAHFLFLGVKPKDMPALLTKLAPVLAPRRESCVLVSMAAGLSIARLRELAGFDAPIVRICPNTPASIGKGLTVWCAEGVRREDADELAALMAGSGTWDECPENLMDVAGVLGGCTPAFVYMFLEALSDGAVACGLSRQKALLYAAQAVEGAAALCARSGEHPGALKDAVCSPGGSTIEGVLTLEAGAFRSSVSAAVRAACEKTRRMG